MADPLIFVRGVHFAATLVACGTVGFIHLVMTPAKVPSDVQPLRNRLTALTLLALVVAIVSGAVWLLLLAADILGAPLPDVCLHGGAWPVLSKHVSVSSGAQGSGWRWCWLFHCFVRSRRDFNSGARSYCCACLHWLGMQVQRLA